MAVNLCIRAYELQPETIARVLVALVEMDVDQYASGLVTRSPFTLRWVPDPMGDTAMLRDAYCLTDRGYGSCGELACAYAAWLQVHSRGEGKLDLLSNGENAWHVVANAHGRVYDPQHSGVNRGAVP